MPSTTTWLQASQELAKRVRTTGSGPTDVTGQVTQYQDVIRAVKKAHDEIVKSHTDWKFMWSEATVDVSVGAEPFTPVIAGTPTRVVASYDKETFYLDSDGAPLDWMEWVDYKKLRLTPNEQAQTQTPQQIVVRPDNLILTVPYTNASLTINFDCWKELIVLALKTDVLDIPDDGMEALYDRAHMLWLGDNESPAYEDKREDFMATYKLLEDAYWPKALEASRAEDQEIVVNASYDGYDEGYLR